MKRLGNWKQVQMCAPGPQVMCDPEDLKSPAPQALPRAQYQPCCEQLMTAAFQNKRGSWHQRLWRNENFRLWKEQLWGCCEITPGWWSRAEMSQSPFPSRQSLIGDNPTWQGMDWGHCRDIAGALSTPLCGTSPWSGAHAGWATPQTLPEHPAGNPPTPRHFPPQTAPNSGKRGWI